MPRPPPLSSPPSLSQCPQGPTGPSSLAALQSLKKGPRRSVYLDLLYFILFHTQSNDDSFCKKDLICKRRPWGRTLYPPQAPPTRAPSPRWGEPRPSLEGRSQPGLCSQTLCSPGRLFPPCVRESVMFLACPPGGQCRGEGGNFWRRIKGLSTGPQGTFSIFLLSPFIKGTPETQKQQVFDPRSVSYPGSRV